MVGLTGFAIIGFTNRISHELEHVEKGQYNGTTIITNDSTLYLQIHLTILEKLKNLYLSTIKKIHQPLLYLLNLSRK